MKFAMQKVKVPVFWMPDPEAHTIKSPFVRQPAYHDLENRVAQLEDSLEKYQRVRVHDVNEKEWLRDRVNALQAELAALRPQASEGTEHD